MSLQVSLGIAEYLKNHKNQRNLIILNFQRKSILAESPKSPKNLKPKVQLQFLSINKKSMNLSHKCKYTPWLLKTVVWFFSMTKILLNSKKNSRKNHLESERKRCPSEKWSPTKFSNPMRQTPTDRSLSQFKGQPKRKVQFMRTTIELSILTDPWFNKPGRPCKPPEPSSKNQKVTKCSQLAKAPPASPTRCTSDFVLW